MRAWLIESVGFWGAFQLACLLVFLAVNGGRAVSLIVRHRVNPIMLRARKRGLQGLAELSLFVNVNLWAAAVVLNAIAPGLLRDIWLFRTLVSDLRVIRLVGFILIVLAFVILVLGQLALGKAWRLGIDEKHPGALVTDGIYAVSRNPIYLFFDFYFLGTFLLNRTLFFALAALFTMLNLHYQILNEEQHLEQVHGERYRAYHSHTARYWRVSSVLRLPREASKVDTG